jgi:hypothetical protein
VEWNGDGVLPRQRDAQTEAYQKLVTGVGLSWFDGLELGSQGFDGAGVTSSSGERSVECFLDRSMLWLVGGDRHSFTFTRGVKPNGIKIWPVISTGFKLS